MSNKTGKATIIVATIVLAIIMLIVAPIIVFFIGWFTGWLTSLTVGGMVVEGLNHLGFSLTVDQLPIFFGAIGSFVSLIAGFVNLSFSAKVNKD